VNSSGQIPVSEFTKQILKEFAWPSPKGPFRAKAKGSADPGRCLMEKKKCQVARGRQALYARNASRWECAR